MGEPLFLKPVFHEKIWGGNHLKTEFNYNIPSDKTGECWAISAHSHGVCEVLNGEFKGAKLDDLWENNQELFGYSKEPVFPLLTKILDADADLSVQVHPDDSYAKIHEGELGKTECWYIISAEPGAKIYYGHNAKSKEELSDWINNGRWDTLFREIPVKAGEFYYVPSGTIHALGAGIMVLETQQSSDTTYRVYDFDRVDKSTGEKRELHLKQSIDVTTVPHQDPILDLEESNVDDAKIITFVQPPTSPYFKVEKLALDGQVNLKRSDSYTLVSVIDGTGKLNVDDNEYDLKKGQHFIIVNNIDTWRLKGQLTLIMSSPNQ